MPTSQQTQNALERFITKTRDLFTEESDPERRWTELTPILAELLADPEVVEAAKQWTETGFRDDRATNLLFYEDPDFGFAINGLHKRSDREGRTLIHDHAHIYTLYGVLDGHERIERYERLDDRSKPDYAEIRRSDDVVVGPGDIDLVRPYQVHAEVAMGERTVAVVVRSQKGGEFNQGRYDPETNEYWESLGPRQISADMLPVGAA